MDLPILRISKADFDGLFDYSATYPTGTTPGKRWKRLDGSHDVDFLRRGGKPRWMICEYGEEFFRPFGGVVGDINPSDPKGPLINLRCRFEALIEINRYRPVIRVPAGSKPMEAAHG